MEDSQDRAYQRGMKRNVDLRTQWETIPGHRRHIYFLSALLLVCVIGNGWYSGTVAQDNEEIAEAAAQAEHIKNVSDSMLTLAH